MKKKGTVVRFASVNEDSFIDDEGVFFSDSIGSEVFDDAHTPPRQSVTSSHLPPIHSSASITKPPGTQIPADEVLHNTMTTAEWESFKSQIDMTEPPRKRPQQFSTSIPTPDRAQSSIPKPASIPKPENPEIVSPKRKSGGGIFAAFKWWKPAKVEKEKKESIIRISVKGRKRVPVVSPWLLRHQDTEYMDDEPQHKRTGKTVTFAVNSDDESDHSNSDSQNGKSKSNKQPQSVFFSQIADRLLRSDSTYSGTGKTMLHSAYSGTGKTMLRSVYSGTGETMFHSTYSGTGESMMHDKDSTYSGTGQTMMHHAESTYSGTGKTMLHSTYSGTGETMMQPSASTYSGTGETHVFDSQFHLKHEEQMKAKHKIILSLFRKGTMDDSRTQSFNSMLPIGKSALLGGSLPIGKSAMLSGELPIGQSVMFSMRGIVKDILVDDDNKSFLFSGRNANWLKKTRPLEVTQDQAAPSLSLPTYDEWRDHDVWSQKNFTLDFAKFNDSIKHEILQIFNEQKTVGEETLDPESIGHIEHNYSSLMGLAAFVFLQWGHIVELSTSSIVPSNLKELTKRGIIVGKCERGILQLLLNIIPRLKQSANKQKDDSQNHQYLQKECLAILFDSLEALEKALGIFCRLAVTLTSRIDLYTSNSDTSHSQDNNSNVQTFSDNKNMIQFGYSITNHLLETVQASLTAGELVFEEEISDQLKLLSQKLTHKDPMSKDELLIFFSEDSSRPVVIDELENIIASNVKNFSGHLSIADYLKGNVTTVTATVDHTHGQGMPAVLESNVADHHTPPSGEPRLESPGGPDQVGEALPAAEIIGPGISRASSSTSVKKQGSSFWSIFKRKEKSRPASSALSDDKY